MTYFNTSIKPKLLLSYKIIYMQHSLNVLYFFDEQSGSWLPMPLNWERHVPGISNMTTNIQVCIHAWSLAYMCNTYEFFCVHINIIIMWGFFQQSCPGWKDAKSIVAMLRCCNYNQDECINMYNTINDDGKTL